MPPYLLQNGQDHNGFCHLVSEDDPGRERLSTEAVLVDAPAPFAHHSILASVWDELRIPAQAAAPFLGSLVLELGHPRARQRI